MSKYIKGDYTAVVEHSAKTCAINLYIQNTKLGCGLIIPRSTKVGTEYHTTTHSNLFGATTETDKRGIYDEQKIFDELTELGKNIVDFMVFCAGYEKPFIDEAKICKAVELPEPFKTGVDIGVIKSNKTYLKWEDLEFGYGTKTQKVRMGDTIYKIAYRCDGIKEVQLLSEDEKLLYIIFVGKYKDNVQLFNDLHLEVVDNE